MFLPSHKSTRTQGSNFEVASDDSLLRRIEIRLQSRQPSSPSKTGHCRGKVDSFNQAKKDQAMPSKQTQGWSKEDGGWGKKGKQVTSRCYVSDIWMLT